MLGSGLSWSRYLKGCCYCVDVLLFCLVLVLLMWMCDVGVWVVSKALLERVLLFLFLLACCFWFALLLMKVSDVGV